MRRTISARHRRFALVLALACFAGTLAAAPPWPFRHRRRRARWIARIEQILREPNQASADWGIYIYSLDRRRVLFSYHGDRLFVPASNTKLFTIAATLCRVGPNYRFHTRVEASRAPDSQGRVEGNLILVGHGDPTLSGRLYPYPNPHLKLKPNPPDTAMAALARQIAARGIKSVDGDIVGDDTYFRYQPYPDDWAQDDLMWGYGAPISALAVDDNQYQMQILPGAQAGERASVSLHPWLGAFRVDNQLLTVPAGGKRDIEIDRPVGSNTLHLWGTIPLGDRGDHETLAVGDPALFAAQLLKRDLERQGVMVYGRARARHCRAYPRLPGTTLPPCTPSAAAATVAELTSPPLGQDLQWILKVSQNLHAELMLRLLGKRAGGDGSLASGMQARQAFLNQAGIAPNAVYFVDGSGLSRATLVKPSALVRLLRYMARQPAPLARDFRSYLPVAGRDGSLENRFLNTPAAGNLLGKTGSVEHVRALSGYAVTRRGDHLAYSIVVNNDNLGGRQMRAAIDRIALAMLDQ